MSTSFLSVLRLQLLQPRLSIPSKQWQSSASPSPSPSHTRLLDDAGTRAKSFVAQLFFNFVITAVDIIRPQRLRPSNLGWWQVSLGAALSVSEEPHVVVRSTHVQSSYTPVWSDASSSSTIDKTERRQHRYAPVDPGNLAGDLPPPSSQFVPTAPTIASVTSFLPWSVAYDLLRRRPLSRSFDFQ